MKLERLKELAGMEQLSEGRAGAEKEYRRIILKVINKVLAISKGGPVLDDDIERIIDEAMEEFEGS